MSPTNSEQAPTLMKEAERLLQQKQYREAVDVLREITVIDRFSYLAHMNLGIAKIKFATAESEALSFTRNSYFHTAIDDFNMAIELLEKLPKSDFNSIHGNRMMASCYYYLAVSVSHNLLETPALWPLKRALGYLDTSLEYNNDASVREYRRKIASLYDSI